MSKANILLLEDDLQLSDTIKQFLEHLGYQVSTETYCHTEYL